MSWFRRGPFQGPLDFLGKIQAPLQVLAGGYIPATRDLENWTQVAGDRVPPHKRLPHPLSRIGRRLLRHAGRAGATL